MTVALALNISLLSVVLSICTQAQTSSGTAAPAPAADPASHPETNPSTSTQIGANGLTQTQLTQLKTDLLSQDKEEFQLSLGIGSLITGPNTSDYNDQSNILQSTNLGRSSPQYLVGVSLRTPFRNIKGLSGGTCGADSSTPNTAAQSSPAAQPTTPAANSGTAGNSAKVDSNAAKSGEGHGAAVPASAPTSFCWKQEPWKAFLSLKFASGASQTLNGFVIGGTYQFGRYVDAMAGFGLTPFNEPSHGLRITASQYVTAQQKLGNYQNFDPVAMLAGTKNAFDGFSLLDVNGKLIYAGAPLETHYRGGLVLGISIPLTLKSALGGK